MTASSPDEWSTEQPELPVEEQLPRAFGRYLLLARIAQGGMGELYLARRGDLDDEHQDDLHVVKKLRAEHTRDREYVARFVDEARLVVQLSHPNICQVVDVGRVKDEYFLTMEYIAGRDVRDLQTRLRDDGGTLETGDALLIVSDVLKALEYAHHRTHAATGELLHLVHRDVSPQNVMVSFTGEVKLIDFGLASSRLKLERTQPNVVMGKMAYMSPEQARGDTIDKRTDVFAAGVLAYELLVGERFYETMTSHEIWNVVGRGGFRPRRWEYLDERVAEVLSRALEADIALRYPSAGDFRADLDALLHASFGGRNEQRLGRFMRGVYGADVRRERALVRGFDALRGSVVRDLLEGTSPHGISLASSMERPAVHRQGGEPTPGQERTLVQPLPNDMATASQNAPVALEQDPTTERSREARDAASDERALPSLPWSHEHEETTPSEGQRLTAVDADPTTLLGLSPSTTGGGSGTDHTDVSGGESVRFTSLVSRIAAHEQALRDSPTAESPSPRSRLAADSRLLLAAVCGALLLALLLWAMWVPRQPRPEGGEATKDAFGTADEVQLRRGEPEKMPLSPSQRDAVDAKVALRAVRPLSSPMPAPSPLAPSAPAIDALPAAASSTTPPPNEVQRPPPRGALRGVGRPAPALRGRDSGPETRDGDTAVERSKGDSGRGAPVTPNPPPETPSRNLKATVKDNVATVLRCGLPSPCGKGEIGSAFALRYKSMTDEEKRRFEAEVATCLTRCQR